MRRRSALPAALLVASLLAHGTLASELTLTPAQTEGPYYPAAKPAETDADLTRVGAGPAAKGQVLALDGRVLDPSGKPIAEARVEIWQTDAQGIYMHPGDRRTGGRDKDFRFYGEARTDAAGGFRFRTVLPGPYSGRPRHIHAKITPPGAKTLTTQFYFKGDGELAGDGTARGLGKALELVTLSPVKGADGVETATVTVVVRR